MGCIPSTEKTAADQPLRSVHTATFPALLDQYGISLLVTTYQAGKLVMLRAEGDHLNTHFRAFQARWAWPSTATAWPSAPPCRSGSSTTSRRWPAKLEPAGRHDACFLPRSSHVTGNIQIHEMAWGIPRKLGDGVGSEGELWFVNTRFSCLCTLDRDHSFVPRWRPPFVTALAPEDRCHLNGLAMVDGRPRYVTALGATDTPARLAGEQGQGRRPDGRGHRRGRSLGGLSMPHSPRWYAGRLWVLRVGHGRRRLRRSGHAAATSAVAELPGFTRGLDFAGRLAFVGLSQVRETAVFSGIPITERPLSERTCGVWVVDMARRPRRSPSEVRGRRAGNLRRPGAARPALPGPDQRRPETDR